MNLGIRGKIFIVSFLVTVMACLPAALYFDINLRNILHKRTQSELKNYLSIFNNILKKEKTLADSIERIKQIHQDNNVKNIDISIFDKSGKLIFSTLVPKTDNFSQEKTLKPEIIASKNLGIGFSTRYDTTLDDHRVFIAQKFKNITENGFLRMSKSVSDLEKSFLDNTAFILFCILILSSFIATSLSLGVSKIMGETLKRLISSVKRLLLDDEQTSFEDGSIESLSVSISKLSVRVEKRLKALSSQKNTLSEIINSMKEGVLYLDSNRVIKLYNDSFINFLGLKDNPSGMRFEEIISKTELKELIESTKNKAWSSLEFEIEIKGRQRFFSAWANKVSDESESTVMVLHDITEIRRLERVRRDFIANVSHELRTPVSIISLNCETIIENENLEKKQLNIFIDAIKRNSIRLSNLISDLLDLSKIESGAYSFDIINLDLKENIYAIMKALEQKALSKKINVEYKPTKTLKILADLRAFQQIMTNLIENAIKYTQDGGNVKIYSHDIGNFIEITVEDDGPGIDPEIQHRLFERFFRVDTGRSRDMGGTGLGLSIVKNLAEAMNGSVSIDSSYHDGSRFFVKVPKSQ